MVGYLKKYRHIIFSLLFLLLLCGISIKFWKSDEKRERAQEASREKVISQNAGVCASFQKNIFDTGIISSKLLADVMTQEERAAVVYSFLQGPRAYREGLPWSGNWCEKTVDWNSFGGFGCGLCCMANIYSTLSPYECSPWDMYEFATESSYYYPTKESGAIGWTDMRMALRAAGLACDLYRKPSTYKKFKKQMKESKSAVVLVSSANDDTFWKDTPGHYVNIWYYKEDTEEVFLAEPGDPENNRTWIPLRYVYDALKTVSQYQYLAVTTYYEGANIWKQDGIDDVWNGKFFEIK